MSKFTYKAKYELIQSFRIDIINRENKIEMRKLREAMDLKPKHLYASVKVQSMTK